MCVFIHSLLKLLNSSIFNSKIYQKREKMKYVAFVFFGHTIIGSFIHKNCPLFKRGRRLWEWNSSIRMKFLTAIWLFWNETNRSNRNLMSIQRWYWGHICIFIPDITYHLLKTQLWPLLPSHAWVYLCW